MAVGTALGRAWAAGRFAGVYLRSGPWEVGYCVDIMETAVPWARATVTLSAMQQAAHEALHAHGERALTFSHLLHVSAAGCSL